MLSIIHTNGRVQVSELTIPGLPFLHYFRVGLNEELYDECKSHKTLPRARELDETCFGWAVDQYRRERKLPLFRLWFLLRWNAIKAANLIDRGMNAIDID